MVTSNPVAETIEADAICKPESAPENTVLTKYHKAVVS